MPKPTNSAISLRISIVVLIVASFIAVALYASTRPLERVSSIQTTDGKHVHQIFAKHPLRTEFLATAQGLSGITIEIQKWEGIPEIHLVDTTENREVAITKEITDTAIRLSFEPQRKSYAKKFALSIAAPTTTKQKALFIPYESDATKYPNNKVWQEEVEKQGSLGITQFEKPTIALLIARWLALPHQRPLWIGIALISIGIFTRKRMRETTYTIATSPKVHWLWFIFIWITIIAIYYPATNLFFYSDDVPILARTAYMTQHHPFLLFTPHQYQDTDPRAAFGFDFWRPVSFAIYPFLLHLLLPPSAWVYYFINIALFACVGCLLFRIATIILQSKPASLFAVALWATSSSKLGVVYWWSSVQDILASLFAMTAIVLYLAWRSKNKNSLHYMSVAAYLLGMFSKEYVIITPLAIAGLEILLLIQNKKSFTWKKIVHAISPFLIAAGVFLLLNTAVLGDPTLPPRKHTDQTYSLTFSPHAIIRNTIIYTSATAEARLWPHINSVENALYQYFKFWEVKTSGPYYPGVAICITAILLPLLFWRKKNVAYTLLFGVGWWLIFMGPILLFANDWKLRWLMLATFGTGIMWAALLQNLLKNIPKQSLVFAALAILLCIYGYENARSPELNRFYKEQSEYVKEAYNQLKKQEKSTEEEKRIILVGITPDQETSLNAYLFRLYAKNPQADIIYRDSLPETNEGGDVIINMIGIIPYYPDSEK